MSSTEDTRVLLDATVAGDAVAAERLTPRVYEELRRLAGGIAGQVGGRTLQPTALVHEAFLKMADHPGMDGRSETHFKAVAALAMRQVLIDSLRSKGRVKRGGDRERVTLSGLSADSEDEVFDTEALEQALVRLHELDDRAARVVEMRFFGGLTEGAIAGLLGVTDRTVRADWSMARAWLKVELSR